MNKATIDEIVFTSIFALGTIAWAADLLGYLAR